MTRKTLSVAILSVFFLLPFGGNLAHAQTVTTGDLDTLKSQIVSLLTQEIALLQGQLNDMLAVQNQQATQISQLSTPASAPASSPLFGGTTPISVSIALGQPVCDLDSRTRIGIPVNVSGGDWKIVKTTYDGYSVSTQNDTYQIQINGQRPFPRITSTANATPSSPFIYPWNIPGDYHITGVAYDGNDNQIGTFSQTVTIGNQCPDSGVTYATDQTN